jgi:hypothetical protein
MKIDNSLDGIRIASPCPVSWDRMTGDDRVRHCDECQLSVYNIAELTRAEAEALIANSEGRVCARIYRRADGTVITRDCPVGLRAIRRRVAMTAGAVFAAVMALTTSVFGQKQGSKDKDSCRPQVTMTRDAKQAQNGLSTVTGTILDANGAVIPGATITIAAEAPAKPLTTSADDKGSFLLTGFDSGTYTITVESPGFKKFQLTSVHLASNEKLNLEVTMLIDGSVLTGIIMPYYPSLIDSPPGTFIINDKMIQRLPIHED